MGKKQLFLDFRLRKMEKGRAIFLIRNFLIRNNQVSLKFTCRNETYELN